MAEYEELLVIQAMLLASLSCLDQPSSLLVSTRCRQANPVNVSLELRAILRTRSQQSHLMPL